MATFQATTVSDGATITDEVAVAQLCEQFHFGTLDWRIDNQELTIFGNDAFELYPKKDNGDPDYQAGEATETFLSKLADYISNDEQLDIMVIGHTKCRYPVHARRYIVSNDEILTDRLDNPTPIEAAG